MLVYSTRLWLGCEFDLSVEVISEWFSRKLKEPVDKLKIKQDGMIFTKGSDRLQVARVANSWPQLQSIRYTQPDSKVKGRLWKTEISLRQHTQESEVEVTIVLSTSEISTRVTDDIQLTRPLVIRDLLEKCSPVSPTPGIQIKDIDETNASDYLEYVLSHERHSPIVLISPNLAKEYPIEAEDLLFQLMGIADVIRVRPDADTFKIQEIVGDRYAAWRGAINIIFPPRRNTGDIYNRLYRLQDIEMLLAAIEIKPEIEFLSIVTHRVNLSNSRHLISLEQINEHKRRLELQKSRDEARRTGELDQYVLLLEEDNQKLSEIIKETDERIEEIQEELNSNNGVIEEKEEKIEQLQKQIQGLQASLHFDRAQVETATNLQQIRGAFVNVFNEVASISEAIQIIEALFPDRIVMLQTAYSSAEESSKFKYPARAFSLLLNLATGYWECLVSGRGDVEARNIFGEAFSPNEGEAEKNHHATKLRTFEYKGDSVQMFKHLKIGVKPSIAETLRIHFYWDSKDQKIVIGHCGKHLDHK